MVKCVVLVSNHTKSKGSANSKTTSPTTYARSGVVGTSKSIVSGRNATIEVFNDFLFSKHMPSLNNLTEVQFCDVSLLQEFGTYLKHLIVDGVFSVGTGLQYLSNMKAIGMQKYPDRSIWNDSINNRWMHKLRKDIETYVSHANIACGMQNRFKAPSYWKIIVS